MQRRWGGSGAEFSRRARAEACATLVFTLTALLPVEAAILRGQVTARATGQPVRGAIVSIRLQDREQDFRHAVTGEEGEYEFRDVAPGVYEVRCNKGGYLEAYHGQRWNRPEAAPLLVREGQTLRADFRLLLSAAISGVVRDDSGDPVSGAGVAAVVRQFFRGQYRVSPRGVALTDDRGEFRIHGLPPGRYYVIAAGSGVMQQEGGYQPVIYPTGTSLSEALAVELRQGDDIERIDLSLVRGRLLEVRGAVVDRIGRAASGGQVTCESAGFWPWGTVSAAIAEVGRFFLRGVLPGPVRLIVQADGFAKPVVRFAEVTGDRYWSVRIIPGVDVRGRIVVEGGNAGFAGRKIVLRSLEPFPRSALHEPEATVNADGAFLFTDVLPARYRVALAPRGATEDWAGLSLNDPFYIRDLRLASRPHESLFQSGLAVPEGTPVADLEVIVDTEGGTIAGRAAGAGGDAHVVLLSADPARHDDERLFKALAPAPDGAFEFRGVVPGDYFLAVWRNDPAELLDPSTFEVVRRSARKITVEQNGKVEAEALPVDHAPGQRQPGQ